MTFVAQPYERFVDDLLTALTGGVTREEHLFTGIDQPYALASPGIVAASVKVSGQRNREFVLFEGGIDYTYKPDQEAIVWNQQGRLPDDHSYFYVSYYPQERAPRLTDRNPGSVTATLGEAFAREYAVLHKQMEMIYESAFVDTATGFSLDHVAALLGLDRKDAKFAGGEVLFRRSTPAEGDITIPSGTLVSTDQGQNFETTDKRILRKGQLSVTAAVRAQVEGPAGKVEAGTIKNINRPIFGIESATNDAATFFATEKETDEELRRRVKGTLERAGKSTLDSIKFSLIEEIPGINEGNVQVTEATDAPGRVEVKFGLGSTVDPDLVRRIEETIFTARPAGVRVVHNLPSRSSAPASSNGAAPAEGGLTREEVLQDFGSGAAQASTHFPPEVLGRMDQGILDLQIEVLLRLTEGNLSVSQKENIEDEVRTSVVEFIDTLPMGADIVFNKLLARIVGREEVADTSLQVGAARGTDAPAGPFFSANVNTDGRKARVAMNNVFVGLMGETVLIDLLVLVEETPGATAGTEITAALNAALETDLKTNFVSTHEKLLKSDLRTVITRVLASAAPGLQLITDNAVIVNAQYEESGRVLNNTDEVPVESHQVLTLGSVNVQLQGALDG
ncbi:MAG TPA: baseplate J/gp47 family protein [Pyrinomonadaceae bacterium]|nr:baseplate J/gp47 family protein [Pyrinomonadaceae bacterium]